ncbi:MAG: U32 family peptidase [Gammaproteobacteria bacterium]|nr:U32 family peptidase [Gammaproteobacteria bacterium]
MKKEIELLAPGGDIDSIKAAILAGANAVYCGLDRFNARNRAINITFDDLNGILRLAHTHNCEVFLTLNIIIVESEIPALFTLLNKLVNTSLDGIIIQDLGVFYLLNKYFPTLKIHASTQLTTHNEGQIKFLSQLGATRVNLSRELNLDEITTLTAVSHEHDVLTEVFVHGSNCISFSGLCYMSSVQGGNSGNRGQCSQPCRDQYLTTSEGKDFPLNIKDNSAYSDLGVLYNAGVDSVKIEGRIKKYHYVYTVVDTWRKQLNRFYEQNTIKHDNNDLRKVFNRDFSNSFLKGNISKAVFIDNPRDHSAIHHAQQFSKIEGGTTDEHLATAKRVVFDQKTEIITNIQDQIEQISIEKAPLTISLSGESGAALTVSIKTPETDFDVQSGIKLINVDNNCIDQALVLNRFKALNETEYFIEYVNLDKLPNNLFIPFKELTLLKNKILFILKGSRETYNPVNVPKLKKKTNESLSPALSLLISSQEDLPLCDTTSAEIYFQLPDSFQHRLAEFIELFTHNQRLIPWFPAVLLSEDYHAAVEFLEQVQPVRIVTNNTGVAFTAYKKGIAWTAGPYMNLVNSFSLLCLKENFNCEGAFISNEINKIQIKGIKKPDNFKLIYSISHPIVLMTSRVCMFHQVTGCKKNIVDEKCIQRCERSSSITNLNNVSYFIDKEKGGYHHVYNESNFLNTDIVTDVPNIFDNFFIDLRDIKTSTNIDVDKAKLVSLFGNLLNDDPDSIQKLNQSIYPSTNTQYRKGI